MKAMYQLFNYKISRALRVALLLTLALGVAVVIYTRQAEAKDQDLQKLNRFVGSTSQHGAMQIFRQGRDRIEAQNWRRPKFKGFPDIKDRIMLLITDGYALKQGLKDEAALHCSS
jgi:hypothetical protein